MIIVYTFPVGNLNNQMVELEYFCRGACVLESINLEWSSSGNTIKIFVEGNIKDKIKTSLINLFGNPSEIVLTAELSMCILCNGLGQRSVMQFENYQPTGFKSETCCDCYGSGVRQKKINI